MQARKAVVAMALLAGMAAAARAQSVGQMIGSDVKNGVGDMVGVWLSPFHDSAKDWLMAAGAVAAAAAVSPADVSVDDYFFRNHGSYGFLNPVREGGVAFAGSTVTPVAAGLYVIAIATKSQTLRDAVWGCAASYGAESLVRTQIIYRVVSRVRPDSIRSSGGSGIESQSGDQYKFKFGNHGWGQQATPAGHFGNVMACASFLSHRFDMGWGEPVAYAAAAAVGVGRMVDRRHWLSDTVLGGFFGYAIGNTIAARSKHRLASQSTSSSSGGDASQANGSNVSSTLSNIYIAPDAAGHLALGFSRSF